MDGTCFKGSQMKKRLTGISMIILVLGISPINASGQHLDPTGHLIVGYDFSGLLNISAILGHGLAFWGGFKFSVVSPNGKKYKWSQDRAETFYDSEFMGYSRNIYLGFGGGLSYAMFSGRVIAYAGIGYLSAARYRQYHDDTFTVWSNDYYIDDGSISKSLLDKTAGLFIAVDNVLLGIGYSTGTSSFSINLGFSFE
jgi:hypothetical protein